MKKVSVIILALLAVIIYSCKQEKTPLPPENPYSTWYVNGQKFTTNNIRVDKGKVRCILSTYDYSNYYSIRFNLGAFPANSSFLVDCGAQNPSWCCFSVAFQDTGYVNPKNVYLQASIGNGHTQYTVPETWMYNSYRLQEDSILVSGTFVVP